MKLELLKLAFLSALCLCIGFKTINLPQEEPPASKKAISMEQPLVMSANVLIVWNDLNHNVSISQNEMIKLQQIAKLDPERFKEIMNPCNKLSSEEFVSIINQYDDEKLMMVSLNNRN